MRAETLEDGTALGIVGIFSGRRWTRFARPLCYWREVFRTAVERL